MSLRKTGVALLAVLVIGAIVASSASAENEFNETGGQWYTGASPGTRLPVESTVDLGTVVGPSDFITAIIINQPVQFSSTAVTGNECSLVNFSLSLATADCKSLSFQGVTVSGSGATGCSTNSTITTKELSGFLGMNKAGTLETLKITPKAGAGSAFALIELTGGCANAGLYKMTGTVFAQAENATGVFSKTQEFTFSEAIQKAAGTATSLKFGEDRAFINGSLSGTAAVQWAGKEK